MGGLAVIEIARDGILTFFKVAGPLMLVALIILRSGWKVLADSGHILLEGSPPGFDVRAVKDDIRAALPFVLDVHHVHAWSISEERPMVTLHASVAAGTDFVTAVRQIKRMLAEHFEIEHATVEIEYDACGDDPDHDYDHDHDHDRDQDHEDGPGVKQAACRDA